MMPSWTPPPLRREEEAVIMDIQAMQSMDWLFKKERIYLLAQFWQQTIVQKVNFNTSGIEGRLFWLMFNNFPYLTCYSLSHFSLRIMIVSISDKIINVDILKLTLTVTKLLGNVVFFTMKAIAGEDNIGVLGCLLNITITEYYFNYVSDLLLNIKLTSARKNNIMHYYEENRFSNTWHANINLIIWIRYIEVLYLIRLT
ncbi:hypothetical protein L9F63_000105, partial [Diploptera punctata]